MGSWLMRKKIPREQSGCYNPFAEAFSAMLWTPMALPRAVSQIVPSLSAEARIVRHFDRAGGDTDFGRASGAHLRRADGSPFGSGLPGKD